MSDQQSEEKRPPPHKLLIGSIMALAKHCKAPRIEEVLRPLRDHGYLLSDAETGLLSEGAAAKVRRGEMREWGRWMLRARNWLTTRFSWCIVLVGVKYYEEQRSPTGALIRSDYQRAPARDEEEGRKCLAGWGNPIAGVYIVAQNDGTAVNDWIVSAANAEVERHSERMHGTAAWRAACGIQIKQQIAAKAAKAMQGARVRAHEAYREQLFGIVEEKGAQLALTQAQLVEATGALKEATGLLKQFKKDEEEKAKRRDARRKARREERAKRNGKGAAR